MDQIKKILTYGFAFFAMFFGSGNLVFPIFIGYFSADAWIYGFLGLFFTGIILPFMGLFVIKLYNGDYEEYFNQAGILAKYVMPFVTISLLGSFGVVPRCITVAYGGISFLSDSLSLWVFASIFCIFSYLLSLRENLMIIVIGKIMSPILLLFLGFIIFTGVFAEFEMIHKTSSEEAFMNGFFTGYQTMDLFAAFFFSSLIFLQIKNSEKNKDDKNIFKIAVYSSILGSVLLSVVYMGFVYLGAKYSSILGNTESYHFLPTISQYLIGSHASLFLAISIILSCITTAVALNGIYARYLQKLVGAGDKYFPLILFFTTSVSLFISLFDFKNISGFLTPILEITYPGLIILAIFSILTKRYRFFKIITFWSVTSVMMFVNIFGNFF